MLRVVPAGFDQSISEQLPRPVFDFQRMFAVPSRLDGPAGLFSFVLYIVATDLTQCSFGSPQVVLQPANLLPALSAHFLRLVQVALVRLWIFRREQGGEASGPLVQHADGGVEVLRANEPTVSFELTSESRDGLLGGDLVSIGILESS